MMKNIKFIGRCIKANVAFAIVIFLVTAIVSTLMQSPHTLFFSTTYFLATLLASVIANLTRKKRIYLYIVAVITLLGFVFGVMSFEYIAHFCNTLAIYLFLWLFVLRAYLKEVSW